MSVNQPTSKPVHQSISQPVHQSTKMFFPISDDDTQLQGYAPVTIALIVLNAIVFIFLQQTGANEAFTYGWSVIPYEIVNGVDLTAPESISIAGESVSIPQAPGPAPIYLTILSAMFMHGGWMHLLGNLLYLWIFGDNVEHRFGKGPFLLFYLASGVVATFAQIVLDTNGVIPNLGASGAIAGVLGAYLVLFPRNRVRAIFLWFVVSVPAMLAIGVWIVMQFVGGWGSIIGQAEAAGGVAYAAHIGGFVAGVVMALGMRMYLREEPADPFKRINALDKSRRYW